MQTERSEGIAVNRIVGVLAIACFVLAVTAACGGDDNGSSGESNKKLNVVTTVAPLTNIVKNIGGDRIDLTGIIPDGVDSHTFEPRPENAKQLANADIFIMNGAHLEGSSEKVAEENLKDSSKIYKLAENTLSGDDEKTGFLYDFSFPRSGGDPNPHLWMNPQYARKYAELTAGWLSDNDPANKSYYQDNLQAFDVGINRLDSAIRAATATVPQSNRKLLTYHDSWAYWARQYGWSVIGAIQPSDFSEPSAQDVARLIDQIKAEKVPAIFGSEVFPSPVTEQIARETSAKYINKLSDDEPPGDVGAPEHTYVGMLAFDMQQMIPALGGDAAPFDNFPVQNTYKP
ncbi:MAG: zinc ABC transporter substrate-binding protein [Chloroflexi bacterium]|nr:MAG: zinc ABC transporter substrate-binding protein [Chloroflexota bacterium]